MCITGRICNRCTGFVAMAKCVPDAKCQRGTCQKCTCCIWPVCNIAQVFESSQPWYYDSSLVKVAVTDSDNETQCLAVRRLHYNVSLAAGAPVGSRVAHIQLQQLPCLSKVRARITDVNSKSDIKFCSQYTESSHCSCCSCFIDILCL